MENPLPPRGRVIRQLALGPLRPPPLAVLPAVQPPLPLAVLPAVQPPLLPIPPINQPPLVEQAPGIQPAEVRARRRIRQRRGQPYLRGTNLKCITLIV